MHEGERSERAEVLAQLARIEIKTIDAVARLHGHEERLMRLEGELSELRESIEQVRSMVAAPAGVPASRRGGSVEPGGRVGSGRE